MELLNWFFRPAKERRRFDRIRVVLRMRLTHPEGIVRDATTQDVSLEGLHFLSTNPPRAHDRLKILLQLPREQPIEAEAVVAWCRPLTAESPGLCEGGLVFSNLPAAHRARWHRFISQMAESAAERHSKALL